jgi:hypothetical protein
MMSFIQALSHVIEGENATREMWDNPKVQMKMHGGKLCFLLDDGLNHPALITQEDIDGDDWMIVPKPGPKMIGAVEARPAPANPAKAADPAGACAAPVEGALDPRDQCGKDA